MLCIELARVSLNTAAQNSNHMPCRLCRRLTDGPHATMHMQLLPLFMVVVAAAVAFARSAR